MNLEALVLGLFSGVRPGTGIAAVLVLLESPRPRRLLVVFTAAGFAWSWAIGLLVLGVFQGANVAVGGSTFTAVLDVAFGVAALGFAAGLHWGWVQPSRWRTSSPSAAAGRSRFGRDLRNASPRDVVAAPLGTHLPGVVYLAALNAIAADPPGPAGSPPSRRPTRSLPCSRATPTPRCRSRSTPPSGCWSPSRRSCSRCCPRA